jgi:ubiquinone/menaquinone biosynthesis C-methylase UbiE
LSRAEAYRYLPQSIQAFHTAYELAGIMESVGLTEIRIHTLNFGSVCIHVGTKR